MDKPLVLWGGTDISTHLYNKPKSKYTEQPDNARDVVEMIQYSRALLDDGTPIIGVCRGAQFLCVMNGGELYQHSKVDKQSHDIMTNDGAFFNVAADHHQVMKPSGNYELLGWNPEPIKVWVDDETTTIIHNSAEVLWYPDTRCLAIQPHPEWASSETPFNVWINNIMCQLDIDYKF